MLAESTPPPLHLRQILNFSLSQQQLARLNTDLQSAARLASPQMAEGLRRLGNASQPASPRLSCKKNAQSAVWRCHGNLRFSELQFQVQIKDGRSAEASLKVEVVCVEDELHVSSP